MPGIENILEHEAPLTSSESEPRESTPERQRSDEKPDTMEYLKRWTEPPERMGLLLALNDEKPVVSVLSRPHDPRVENSQAKEFRMRTDAFALCESVEKETGLKAKSVFNYTEEGGEKYLESVGVIAGKDAKVLLEMTEASLKAKQANNLNSVHHEKVGRLLGFPETAIEGFVQNDFFKKTELPNDIKQHPYFKLVQFMFSKNNFREEWEDFVSKSTKALSDYPELAQKLELPIGKKY